MEKQRHFYGKKYSSGNPFIDWVFRRFISILNITVKQIIFSSPIKDPDFPNERLLGFWSDKPNIINHRKKKLVYERNTVYIDPVFCKKRGVPIVSVLIHELSHVLFSELVKENSILSSERLLFEQFSYRQRRALSRYLPREEKDIQKKTYACANGH